MRVMVLVKATDDREKGPSPRTEMFAAMSGFNEKLVKAGILRAADGVKPSSHGKRIARSMVSVVDCSRVAIPV
jgi:hypothetical protein